jgi:hypothetical protein
MLRRRFFQDGQDGQDEASLLLILSAAKDLAEWHPKDAQRS